MKAQIFLYFILSAGLLCSCGGQKPCISDPVEYVNPFTGTGGLGFGVGSTFPGASLPFGMVKLSPDTTNQGSTPPFFHCGGYFYHDTEIKGFSHTHLSGTGVPDYGNIRIMPVIGINAQKITEEGYKSKFSHSTEFAEPGYYRVTLEKGNITVELTVSLRAGFMRITFPQSESACILIDVSRTIVPGTCLDSSVRLDPHGAEIYGWSLHRGPMTPAGYTIYFSTVFSKKPVTYGVWEGKRLFPERTTAEGTLTGAYFCFNPEDPSPVLIKTGISYVSIQGARENREGEIPHWDLDRVREEAKNTWREFLERVRVCGGSEYEKTVFYTALYHTLLMPTTFTDINGLYRGLDGQIHEAQGFTFYTDFSLWDTYRNVHSLYTLLYPEFERNMVVSLIEMGKQNGGIIPQWPAGPGDSGSMVGSGADIVIADSYVKGITNFNTNEALNLMLHTSTVETYVRDGLSSCLDYGYCPADLMNGSVSLTLEYAYDDFAIASFAKALGRDDIYREYLNRAMNYKNIFDTETLFMRPRNSDGSWVQPFNPQAFSSHYVEGNAWHYTFFVPFDPEGLIYLFGSKETFVEKLNRFFDLSSLTGESLFPANFFPDIYYWHGNEPDIHSAYLFTFAGRADLTQRWVREIMEKKYSPEPDGLAGNDDGGTLSAWFVFSAMGFYPIPATDIYVVSSPLFKKIELQIKNGTFTVETENHAPGNIYVSQARINGRDITHTMIFHHSEIVPDGKLMLKMSATPPASF